MDYDLVESESELQARLVSGGCRVAAGMTDVYPSGLMTAGAGTLIDISRIDSLRGISHDGCNWRIGATTRWSDMLHYPWPPGLEMLAEMAGQVGAVQVQNAGTVGGNLCNASPAADGVPVLLALDATVELCSPDGIREMPLREFITGVRKTELRDSEYLRAIVFPGVQARASSAFLKLGLRQYLVISIAMAAGQLQCDADGRLVAVSLSLGACSPVAVRLPRLEAALRGQLVSPALSDCVSSDQILPDIQPIDDVRATAVYRSEAAVQIVRDTVSRLTERLL